MTGREKMQAAFSNEGTSEIPAVICYDSILFRDHWSELTDSPWWYAGSPDIKHQLQWKKDAIQRISQDWTDLPGCPSRVERANLFREERADGVYEVDKRTDNARRLQPFVAGGSGSGADQSIHPDDLPSTRDAVDEIIPDAVPFDAKTFLNEGKMDLAREILHGIGKDLYPYAHVSSPLWCCYGLWGFEGMMMKIAMDPDIVTYACERHLNNAAQHIRRAAAHGVAGMWIEECMTDMIGPDAFAALNQPFVRRLIEEIHANGMHAIYYYCGNPADRWDILLDMGADALSLEETKKSFSIDIEDVVARVNGRCCVLGNLHAVEILQDGSDEQLRSEIIRQLAAGRRNGSRFIMSLGSPVTPGTPVSRVRLYCDIVHELGKN